MFRYISVLLLTLPLTAAPVPKGATPRALPANSNALLKAHAGKLTYDCSTQFGGWEIGKLFDSIETTSWYSASNDAPMNGKQPWVMVIFSEDVAVRRMTVLGNREPNFPTGYFVTAGTFELLDAAGTSLQKVDLTSKGEKHDFDLELRVPFVKVRSIRFTCTADEKQMNCIGLAEMQVE